VVTNTSENVNQGTLFVIEGVITDLHVEIGKQNLFAKIDKHYRGKSFCTGIGTATGDLFGQVAASAMLAMYDGEDTENFLCLIDGQVMCGTFAGASKLPVGEKIKAVVHKQGDILVAEGILSESKGLVWIHHAWGSHAERMANFKIGWWCFAFLLLGTFLFAWIRHDLGTEEFWESVGMIALWGGILCFGMALWNGSTMNALASPATDIFRLLGFANPERVNLNSYRYNIVHMHERVQNNDYSVVTDVCCYQKAIEDGKLRMALQSS
jgi:hypothetical protein